MMFFFFNFQSEVFLEVIFYDRMCAKLCFSGYFLIELKRGIWTWLADKLHFILSYEAGMALILCIDTYLELSVQIDIIKNGFCYLLFWFQGHCQVSQLQHRQNVLTYMYKKSLSPHSKLKKNSFVQLKVQSF
jgi:hypothetical protein